MKMKIENFRSQKFSRSNFRLSYFFLKSSKLFDFFFIDRGKIVWKDRKSTLELSILHPQRIKRDLFERFNFGDKTLPGGYTSFRTQLTYVDYL